MEKRRKVPTTDALEGLRQFHRLSFDGGRQEVTAKQSLGGPSRLPKSLALKPFPAVLVKLLGALSRADIGLKQISDIVSQDPALVAKVLQVANSPLYGFSQQIRTVLQATSLLGVERIRALAFTFALQNYFSGSGNPVLQRQAWRHSLATAFIAERLALRWWLPVEETFVAGVLHKIGQLALISDPSVFYEPIISRAVAHTEKELLQIERSYFGTDHHELTLHLLATWGLPSNYLQVIGNLSSETGTERTVASAVWWGCQLATAIGFAAPGLAAEGNPSWEELTTQIPNWGSGQLSLELEELAQEIALRINAIELAQSV